MWNRGVVIACGLGTAAVMALTGCSGGGDSDAGTSGAENVSTRPFQAANGIIQIPEKPQRIVALARAIPSLVTIDAPLVGATDGYDLDTVPDPAAIARYDALDKITTGTAATNAGGGTEISYEAIMALEPDLIISGFPHKAYTASIDDAKLQAIAPTVDVGPTTPVEWREVGRRAADAAGLSEEFDRDKDRYTDLAEKIERQYRDKVDGKNFAALTAYDSTQPDSYNREFDDSFITNIANDVGIRFAGAEPGETSEIVSLERLSDLEVADVILYPVNPDGTAEDVRMQAIIDSPAWKALPAVHAGRLLPIAFTGAETYAGAMQCLDSISAALDRLP